MRPVLVVEAIRTWEIDLIERRFPSLNTMETILGARDLDYEGPA